MTEAFANPRPSLLLRSCIGVEDHDRGICKSEAESVTLNYRFS